MLCNSFGLALFFGFVPAHDEQLVCAAHANDGSPREIRFHNGIPVEESEASHHTVEQKRRRRKQTACFRDVLRYLAHIASVATQSSLQWNGWIGHSSVQLDFSHSISIRSCRGPPGIDSMTYQSMLARTT